MSYLSAKEKLVFTKMARGDMSDVCLDLDIVSELLAKRQYPLISFLKVARRIIFIQSPPLFIFDTADPQKPIGMDLKVSKPKITYLY